MISSHDPLVSVVMPCLNEEEALAPYRLPVLDGDRRVLYFWHSVGNKVLTLLSNMFTELNLTDIETCYEVVRTPLMKSLVLTSDRFGSSPRGRRGWHS
ncbi:MAG: glycosyltransferase [Gemmatimonadales bacterium]|nr:glycosyltransferase [Gemmatimonadales bacterium]